MAPTHPEDIVKECTERDDVIVPEDLKKNTPSLDELLERVDDSGLDPDLVAAVEEPGIDLELFDDVRKDDPGGVLELLDDRDSDREEE